MLHAGPASADHDPESGAVERGVSSARRTARAVGTEWRETGNLGRIGLIGVVLSALLAIVLGFEIRGAVREQLLDVRTELLQTIVDELTSSGADTQNLVRNAGDIARAVDARLAGGEVTGVVVRDAAGDAVVQIGQGLGARGTPPLRRAPSPQVHDEQHRDGRLHFVLPVTDATGTPVGSVEVLQSPESLEGVLDRVTRNVWAAIGIGLGLLGLAMGGLVAANARLIAQGHSDAKRLLQALLRAEEDERRRIVGSLHDDIGQPLYRVLYGLQGCRSRLRDSPDLIAELDRLIELVHAIDDTLHAELRHLHQGVLDELALPDALADLVRTGCDEAGLSARLDVHAVDEPDPVTKSALLRAAQEAIANVRRHADARSVIVRLYLDDEQLVIEIADDGRGHDGREGLGLATSRERLEAVGGELRTSERAGGGTVLRVWVPRPGGGG